MTPNMASATGIPENNPARDEEEPLLGRPGDVTQRPEQGFQWNILTGRMLLVVPGSPRLTACNRHSDNSSSRSMDLDSAGLGCCVRSRLYFLLLPPSMCPGRLQGTVLTISCSLSTQQPSSFSFNRSSSSSQPPHRSRRCRARTFTRVSISLLWACCWLA